MKNLLYIGNKLSGHGLNKTSIETLGVFLQLEGYNVLFSSSIKNKFIRLLDMSLALVKNLNKINIVLIDTYSTSSFWYTIIISQLCRILDIPYISILRGGDLSNRIKRNPLISKIVFENAYSNVAPSLYLKSIFEKAGYQNIIFIPNSIELENYNYKQRSLLQPKLLWVRAFAEIYNPVMAVEVVKELQKKYPNPQLTMIGPDKDGTLKKTQEHAKQLGVEIICTGGLTKKEWTKIAQEHDIFINTTNVDNTPVSIIEAMALGLPVVSTNVGGIPYLLENQSDALLVNKNSPVEMANQIDYLIQNPDLVEKITRNAKRKATSFDWQQVKHQWNILLNSQQLTTDNP